MLKPKEKNKMGHFYPQNLDKLLLNRLYAKGTVSINELVEIAQKRKQTVHAAEGEYDEKFMLQQGFEQILAVHHYREELEPILITRKEKRAFKRWQNGDIWDSDYFNENGESIGDLAVVDNLRWRFTKGQRSHYQSMVLTYIES
jgi:hypothetical protein